MKDRQVNFLLLSIAMLFSVYGCSEHRGFKKTSDGLYYKFHEKGDDTTTLKEGMILTLNLKYSINDSVLFDTDSIPDAFMLPLTEPGYKGDFYAALAMMKPGDSATFITSADSFFIKTVRMPQVPDSAFIGKEIYFDVKLISAKSQEEMEAQRQLEMAEMQEQEQVILKQYLSSANITTQPMESGLFFTEIQKGNNQKPKNGDFGKIHFSVSTITGNQLYDSRQQGEPMIWEKGKEFDNKGVTEALELMSKGSKASIIVPSSLAFGEQGRGQMIAPYTTLLYELELVDIVSKAQFDKEQADKQRKADEEKNKAKREEPAKIQSYVKANNIQATPTQTGLYYIETQKGTGTQAAMGKTVRVHYTGMLLNGTKFDSSLDRGQPIEFVLGQGQVIPGWEEGISLMSTGGKARLIVPSSLAYGENGRMPTIPPSATLIFDVELVEVK